MKGGLDLQNLRLQSRAGRRKILHWRGRKFASEGVGRFGGEGGMQSSMKRARHCIQVAKNVRKGMNGRETWGGLNIRGNRRPVAWIRKARTRIGQGGKLKYGSQGQK